MQRNVAGQEFHVIAFGTTGRVSGAAATITCTLAIDGGSRNALTATNPTEIGSTGEYVFTLTQAETNGHQLSFVPVCSDSSVQILGSPSNVIFTTQEASIKSNTDNIAVPDARTIYVSKAGNDANAGTNPAAPKLTIASALSAASLGYSIRIGAGTWAETNLTLKDGVDIIGEDGSRFVNSHASQPTFRDNGLPVNTTLELPYISSIGSAPFLTLSAFSSVRVNNDYACIDSNGYLYANTTAVANLRWRSRRIETLAASGVGLVFWLKVSGSQVELDIDTFYNLAGAILAGNNTSVNSCRVVVNVASSYALYDVGPLVSMYSSTTGHSVFIRPGSVDGMNILSAPASGSGDYIVSGANCVGSIGGYVTSGSSFSGTISVADSRIQQFAMSGGTAVLRNSEVLQTASASAGSLTALGSRFGALAQSSTGTITIDGTSSAASTSGTITRLNTTANILQVNSQTATATGTVDFDDLGAPLDAAGVRAAIGMAAADLDTQLAGLSTDIADGDAAIIAHGDESWRSIEVAAATESQTRVLRGSTERTPIYFTFTIPGLTDGDFVKTKRTDGGDEESVYGEIAYLYSSNGDHWYRLEYDVLDRPARDLSGIVHYSFTSGGDVASIELLVSRTAADDLNAISAPAQVQVSPGTIVARCGVDLEVAFPANVPITWAKVYFTVKEALADNDMQAVLQIVATNGGAEGDGLVRLNRRAVTDSSHGSLTVAGGLDSISIFLGAATTVKLPGKKTYYYDLKIICDDETSPYVCDPGDFVTRDLVTDAIS